MPDLAIEVISPINSATEVMRKIEDYFEHGVRRVWEVFPDQEMIRVHESLARSRTFARKEILTDEVLFPGFQLAVAELFPEYVS